MTSIALPAIPSLADVLGQSNVQIEQNVSTTVPIIPGGINEAEAVGDPVSNHLTKYISGVNNRFILKMPDNIKVSDSVRKRAIAELSASNALIEKYDLTIDTNTKTANATFIDGVIIRNGIHPRKYGKTGILKVGWNYVRAGLDAGLTKDVITAGVAGAAGYLGFLASGPGAAAVVAAVSGVVGNHVANIKDGVWFDYNIYTKYITAAGKQ